MSKIKLLLDVIEDMNALSESLKTLAGAMGENEEVNEPEKESPKKEEKPEPVKEEPKKEEPKYTKEDVRKALAAKSSEGKTKEVKELLMRHGAVKLSIIDPSEYAAMMEEVKEI